MMSTKESRLACIEAVSGFAGCRDAAQPLGLHFEGPAISRNHVGAHDPALLMSPPMLKDEIQEWWRREWLRWSRLLRKLDDGFRPVSRGTGRWDAAAECLAIGLS